MNFVFVLHILFHIIKSTKHSAYLFSAIKALNVRGVCVCVWVSFTVANIAGVIVYIQRHICTEQTKTHKRLRRRWWSRRWRRWCSFVYFSCWLCVCLCPRKIWIWDSISILATKTEKMRWNDAIWMAYGRRQRQRRQTQCFEIWLARHVRLMCVLTHTKNRHLRCAHGTTHTHSLTHVSAQAEQWHGKSFDLKIVLAELMLRCLHHSRCAHSLFVENAGTEIKMCGGH